jgi:hypothetical protein
MFTDKQGRFEFRRLKGSEYHIKVTKYGFAPLLARIKLAKRAAPQIELTLFVAT